MSNVPSKEDKIDRLLAYLAKKIDENRPSNVVYFIVDILCTYYPTHVPSFSKVWLMDKDLEAHKQQVRDFFKYHSSSSHIAQHFINAGFDSLDSLTFLSTDVLEDIQAYNSTTWLPGHKVRVHQIFTDIGKLIKEYKDMVRSQELMKTMPEGLLKASHDLNKHVVDRLNNEQVYYYQNAILLNKSDPHNAAEPTVSRDVIGLSKIANASADLVTSKTIEALNKMGSFDKEVTTKGCCYTNQ